jgi:integrase
MYSAYVQRAVESSLLPRELQSDRCGIPTGMHFLVSEETQLPIGEVLEFLAGSYLSRLRTAFKKSPRSLEACVYDLKDYFDFLDSRKLEWFEVRTHDVEDYLIAMARVPSAVTGKPFAETTITRRESTVRAFYTWAQAKGLTRHRIDFSNAHLASELKAYPDRSHNPVQSPSGGTPQLKVRYVPLEKLRKILDASGHLRVDVNGEGPPSDRLRLMFECALQAGLRRSEIPALEMPKLQRSIEIAKSRDPLDKCPVELLRKGGEYKTVMFPVWLIQNIAEYMDTARSLAISTRMAFEPDFKDPGYVFVRDARDGKKAGDPFAPRHLSGPMRDAQVRAGVRVGLSEARSPYDRLYGVHAFRHTYAMTEYFARKQSGDPEPWLYVQAQLGHADVSTTTSVYLDTVADFEYEFSRLIRMGIDRVVGRG